MPVKVPRFSVNSRRGLLALVLLQASMRGASAAPEGSGVGKPPRKEVRSKADGTRGDTPGLRWSGIGYVEETPPLDGAEEDAEATKRRLKDTIVVDPFRQTGWFHLGIGTGSIQLTASQPRTLMPTISLHLQGREPGVMMVPWLALNPYMLVASSSDPGRPGPEFPALAGQIPDGGAGLSEESALMPGMNAHGGLDFHFMRNPHVGFGPVVGLRYRAIFWSAAMDDGPSFNSNKAEVGAEWGLHVKARLRDDPAAGDSALIAELSLIRRPFTLFTATYLTAQLRLWRYLSLWFETPLESYRPFNTRDTKLTSDDESSSINRAWQTGSVATSLLGTNALRTIFGLGVTLPFGK